MHPQRLRATPELRHQVITRTSINHDCAVPHGTHRTDTKPSQEKQGMPYLDSRTSKPQATQSRMSAGPPTPLTQRSFAAGKSSFRMLKAAWRWRLLSPRLWPAM